METLKPGLCFGSPRRKSPTPSIHSKAPKILLHAANNPEEDLEKARSQGADGVEFDVGKDGFLRHNAGDANTNKFQNALDTFAGEENFILMPELKKECQNELIPGWVKAVKAKQEFKTGNLKDRLTFISFYPDKLYEVEKADKSMRRGSNILSSDSPYYPEKEEPTKKWVDIITGNKPLTSAMKDIASSLHIKKIVKKVHLFLSSFVDAERYSEAVQKQGLEHGAYVTQQTSQNEEETLRKLKASGIPLDYIITDNVPLAKSIFGKAS